MESGPPDSLPEGDHQLHEGLHPWPDFCRCEGPGGADFPVGPCMAMEVDMSQAGVLYTTPDSTTQAVWEDGPINDQGWSVGHGPHHHPGRASS